MSDGGEINEAPGFHSIKCRLPVKWGCSIGLMNPLVGLLLTLKKNFEGLENPHDKRNSLKEVTSKTDLRELAIGVIGGLWDSTEERHLFRRTELPEVADGEKSMQGNASGTRARKIGLAC